MKSCATHKTCYRNKEEAEEELLLYRARSNFNSLHAGPVNVYRCDFCNFYHFTSKGEINPILHSVKNKKRMDIEGEAFHWHKKLK